MKLPAVTAVAIVLACTAVQAEAQQPDRAPDTVRAALRYQPADVDFLAGMIAHHAQAVAMARWAPTHGASAAVRRLCERIINAQTDEITLMSNWLRDHGQPVPAPDPRGLIHPGMGPMLMPGMLTPAQMAELEAARGAAFDRLFLRGMIQHHRGAVDMVNALFAGGAGEEETVYKLAADIFADQTTEIARMQTMLIEAMSTEGP